MGSPQLTDLEVDLLRRIGRGGDPSSLVSVQEQFADDHGLSSSQLVDPHDPAQGTPVDAIAHKLARCGLITVQEQQGFGDAALTITRAGEARLRNNAA